MNISPIKTREDIAKLHNESLQLRNQQFVLGTVALTVVGLSFWMIPGLTGGSKSVLSYAAVTIFLQLLLIILFCWFVALRRLIGTISSYLKVKNASDWEKDFFQFSTNKNCGYWSQTSWVRLLYIMLGLLLAMNFILVSVAQNLQCWSWPGLVVYIFTAVYVGLIWKFAEIGRKYDKQVEEKWYSLVSKPHKNNSTE